MTKDSSPQNTSVCSCICILQHAPVLRAEYLMSLMKREINDKNKIKISAIKTRKETRNSIPYQVISKKIHILHRTYNLKKIDKESNGKNNNKKIKDLKKKILKK